MANPTQPQLVGQYRCARARISGSAAANTSRSSGAPGTVGTNLFEMFNAGAYGSRIDRITVNAAGTLVATTAGMIRIWHYDGTNYTLVKELAVSAITPSASAVGWTATWQILGGLSMATGNKLYISSHIADSAGNQFDALAEGGDYQNLAL